MEGRYTEAPAMDCQMRNPSQRFFTTSSGAAMAEEEEEGLGFGILLRVCFIC